MEELLREYENTADRLAFLTGCPIGDCSRMGEYRATPTTCPVIGRTNDGDGVDAI